GGLDRASLCVHGQRCRSRGADGDLCPPGRAGGFDNQRDDGRVELDAGNRRRRQLPGGSASQRRPRRQRAAGLYLARPARAAGPAGSADVGQPFSGEVRAVDPEGDLLTYSLLNPIGNMILDPVTGTFTWTPTTNDTPFKSINVQVTDGQGNVVTTTYTIPVV